MNKLLAALMLLSSGCATVGTQKSEVDYCGRVGPVLVSIKRFNGWVGCKEALDTTNRAYALLIEKAGPLHRPWNLEYTNGFIAIDNPLGTTYPANQKIVVRSSHSNAVFHEFLHAYMFENTLSGISQHARICTNDSWRKADADFVGPPRYCYMRN